MQNIFVALILFLPSLASAQDAYPERAGMSRVVERVEVRSATLSNGLDVYLRGIAPKRVFAPSDTIIVSIETYASDSTAGTIGVRWSYDFEGEQMLVNEESRLVTFESAGVTAFQVSKPDGWPLGRYAVEIRINGRSIESLPFEVR